MAAYWVSDMRHILPKSIQLPLTSFRHTIGDANGCRNQEYCWSFKFLHASVSCNSRRALQAQSLSDLIFLRLWDSEAQRFYIDQGEEGFIIRFQRQNIWEAISNIKRLATTFKIYAEECSYDRTWPSHYK